MPSNYNGFDVKLDNGDGLEHPVPNAVVQVRDVTDAHPETGVGAIALADVVADAAGHVAAGVAAVAVGRTLRFTWIRALDGRCASDTQVTF